MSQDDALHLLSDLQEANAVGDALNPVEDLRDWFGATAVSYDGVTAEAVSTLDWLLTTPEPQNAPAFLSALKSWLDEGGQDQVSPAMRLGANLLATFQAALAGTTTRDQAVADITGLATNGSAPLGPPGSSGEVGNAQQDQASETKTVGQASRDLVRVGAGDLWTWLKHAIAVIAIVGAVALLVVIAVLVLRHSHRETVAIVERKEGGPSEEAARAA